MGPNGVVGSTAWHAAGKKGIQPGWVRRDMNVFFPDVQAPPSSGVPPLSDATWTYILDDSFYELNKLTIGGGDKMYVTGQAVLYVKSQVDITGLIKIEPRARLKIYCGGPKVNLAGTYDKTDIPADFQLLGLPSVKDNYGPGRSGCHLCPERENYHRQ